MKRTILYFCGDTSVPGRYSGICDYGRRLGWNVKFVSHGSFPLESYLRIWKPDGIISDSSRFGTKPGDSVPTVYLDADLTDEERAVSATVDRDPEEASRMAFQEFERLGLSNLAFLPPLMEYQWSDWRRDAFIKAAGEKGLKVDVCPKRRRCSDSSATHRAIAKWAAKLHRPCGVFAANDKTGSLFLSICALEGIKIPEEFAVISVDGDEFVTKNSFPSLTSVAAADAEGGRLAAELLDGLMSGTATKPAHAIFGELGLVRNDSTKRYYRHNNDIDNALDLIRRKSAKGLKARDVLALMPGSRRSAEMRFKAETGKTILEAIQSERLRLVRNMLKSTSFRVAEIARNCGYSSIPALHRLFERDTGMTMGEWRSLAEAKRAGRVRRNSLD